MTRKILNLFDAKNKHFLNFLDYYAILWVVWTRRSCRLPQKAALFKSFALVPNLCSTWYFICGILKIARFTDFFDCVRAYSKTVLFNRFCYGAPLKIF